MSLRPESPPRGGTSQLRYLAQLVAVFGLTGVVFLPGYIELFPENVFGTEYGRWQAQLDFISRPHPPVDVLIAGDSRAHAALLPERMGPRVRSIAIGGATGIEIYYLLERYLAAHEPPETLVLSLAPFHFGEADVFWERTVKWKALHPSETLEVFRRAEALQDDALGEPDFRALALHWARLRLNFVGDYAAELRNSRDGRRRRQNQRASEQVEAASGHSYYGREPGSPDLGPEATDDRGFRVSSLLDSYLGDTLELAARHEVDVVFAAMPVNHGSWREIDPGFLAGYHRHVADLAVRHPSVDFRAFLWTLPNDHFGDASHVNERGARIVTDWVGSLLESHATRVDS